MKTQDKSLSVLHVLFHSLPFANVGYDIRSQYILKAQRKLGIDAYGLTGPRGTYKGQKDLIDGITYYRMRVPWLFAWPMENMPNTGGDKLLNYFLKKRLHELIDILRPDVIHAHSPGLTAIPAMEVAKKKGIRFVYEVRGFWEESRVSDGELNPNDRLYRIIRKREERVLTHADRVVTISEGLKKDIVSRGLVEESNILVVPNGVDVEKFQPVPKDHDLIKKLGLAGKVVVGYISSLRKMEGISGLIDAMKYVDESASLLIVGDGQEMENLKGRTKALGLSERVLFPGRVPHKDILKYYSIIDIFAVPRINSKVCHIVTPLKPLEAMAMGKCVLASRVGGLSEMITDGESGFLFEPENVRDLSVKLNYLIKNRNYRSQLGGNALNFVRQERNWEVLCKRYFEVYTGTSGQ